MRIAGSYAYVVGLRWTGSHDAGELDIFDVNNPVNPMRAGGFQVEDYDSSGASGGFNVLNNRASIAAHIGGLQIIDVSNPAIPLRVSGVSRAGWPKQSGW